MRELVLVAAGVVAFAFSFVDYYRRTLRPDFDARAVCAAVERDTRICADTTVQREVTEQVRSTLGPTRTAGAWHHAGGAAFGWLGVVLVFAAALTVAVGLAVPGIVRDLPGRRVVAAMAVLGLASVVTSAFVVPRTGDVPRPILDAAVDYGHGAGFRVVLVAAAVAAAAAVTRAIAPRPPDDGRRDPRSP